VRVAFDVDRGFFGFEEEFSGAAYAEAIIRGFGFATDFDGIFVDDVFIGLSEAGSICHIPAQFLKERVDEFPAKLRFIVGLRTICIYVVVECLDQF
jgi:hypothetical protein